MLENVNSGTKLNTDEFIFESYDIKVGDKVYNRIINKSYVENDDISLDDLAYIKLTHYNYEGDIVVGEMIINKLILEDTENIFRELFNSKYEIEKMYLIDEFWDDDPLKADRKSVENNNSSSFCYRKILGQKKLSKHALGLAIDINPFDNPYTPRKKDGTFDDSLLTQEEKEKLINRKEKAKNNKHIITLGDEVCSIFDKFGFECGGIWPEQSSLWARDWQHFEPTEEKMISLNNKSHVL